jgi:flagella basal body P-ring formation protein FlgA
MRCFLKSTTWAGSAAVVLAVCGIVSRAAPAAQSGPADETRAREAIVEAVRARIGGTAEVRVEHLVVKAPHGEGPLVATPEPGARLGRPIRFSLSRTRSDAPPGMTWTAGYAIATVAVATDCARAARAVPAGAVLSADDIVTERTDPGAILLQRVPAAADVVGARANRRLEPGDLLLHTTVSTRYMVRSGDAVTIRASAEGVEAESRGVATQSGARGDAIRVVNSTSRRALTARIVGPAQVEVIR